MTLDDQIQAYLDGTATEPDVQAVAAALRDDPAAAHLLARHTLLRELLEDEYAGDYLLPAEPLPAPTAAATHRPIRSGWLPQFAGTVALLLLIGLAGAVWRLTILSNTPPAATVAIVAAVSPDVRWQKPAPDLPALARGTSLPAGPVKIHKGSLSLLLSSGVDLTVEGPAEFDLQSDMQVLLAAGHLHAVVPEGAEGFVIEAAGLRVVDLGTEFEVTMPADGRPLVAVSRGVVETSFVNSATRMRIGEAERHRFDPTTRTSEPLGTLSDAVAMNLATRSQSTPTPRAKISRNPADNAYPSTTTESESLDIAANTFISLDHSQNNGRLQLGEPGGSSGLTILPDGSLTVDHAQVAGHSRLHLAGGMLTLGDSQEPANLCLTPGTHLDLVIDSVYLITENVVRLATGRETTVDMQLNGGLVEARRAFVLSERGRGSLLQTGGQFRIQNNLFINSQDPARATRYTIRGGSLVGRGTLRLGDWQAHDGIVRIEGTQPEIHIGGLAIASDRAVLEYLLDDQGVSPITLDHGATFSDRGTLRLIAADNVQSLPQEIVLVRYDTRHGTFARVEFDGLHGEVVYDDEAGEVRLEQITL